MTDWRDKAECLTEDPERFFPKARTPYVLAELIDEAKTVCARCPVAAECLEFAISTGQDYGIFGGLDEKERRKLASPASGSTCASGKAGDNCRQVVRIGRLGDVRLEAG